MKFKSVMDYKQLRSCLCWTLLFQFMFAHMVLAQEDCNMFYLEQPLEQHSCNPYKNGFRFRCTIYGTEVISNLTINWYRANINISDPELVNEFAVFVRIRDRHWMFSDFRINNVVESDAGYYWCQIAQVDQNNSFNSSYVPSQRYALLPLSVYENYPPCSQRLRLSRQISMCAKDGVMLASLSEWPSSTNSTDEPIGTFDPTNSTVDSMEGMDPIVLIVLASVLPLIITVLLLLFLIVYCKLICKAKWKSEMSGNDTEIELTPERSREIDSEVTERDTDARYLDNTGQMADSYISLHDPLNTYYHAIPNTTFQDSSSLQPNTQSNGTSITTVHVSPLNSARVFTSFVPVAPADTDNNSEDSSSLPLSGSNECVTVRDGHEYRVIDPRIKDKTEHLYTDRRKPPPVLPKKGTIKHLGNVTHNNTVKSGASNLSLLVSDPMETKQRTSTDSGKIRSKKVSSQQADPQRSISKPAVGGHGIRMLVEGSKIPTCSSVSTTTSSIECQVQSPYCNDHETNHKPQQYQSLIPDTKDHSCVYTSPQATPTASQLDNSVEYQYI